MEEDKNLQVNLLISKHWERIANEKTDSELAYFNSLMYLGEVISKITCLFMLSGLNDSQKNYKYTQLYKLVRANGIGDWSNGLEELLTGPSSQELKFEYNVFNKELTDKTGKIAWQNQAVSHLNESLKLIGHSVSVRENKLQLKTWFGNFAYLRNKTRGHGAITISDAKKINTYLEPSLRLISENFGPFKLQWAYLSQNLSGKYKVLDITNNTDNFAYLKSSLGTKSYFEPGIYTYINEPIKVDLIFSDENLNEFFFPNGSFKKNSFELLSYSTGAKIIESGERFLIPPGELPKSETKGLEELNVVGNCFTNIPEQSSYYINRPTLEDHLKEILNNERHPIVTLIGRGGTGKTTLALKSLHDLCLQQRFENIFWFSSRDIDLMANGAKRVQPDILDIKDVINEFYYLTGSKNIKSDETERTELFKNSLQEKNIPSLFVFDNFETVSDQFSMFSWLDTHIRLPNKILITSRMNEFKADYPISIGGMEYSEFKALINNVSERLGIESLISEKYIDQLFEESTGHPYVAKILLGQVANEGKVGDIKRIIADKENVLQALFERTYSQISTAAKRVFLTLGSWRTTIPKIAVEAVLKSTIEEAIDVEKAIEELYRFSLIDEIKTKEDDILLSLPISAQLFAEKKLKTDIYQFAIRKDVNLLMKFGVGRNTELDRGINDRISRFIKEIAEELVNEKSAIDKYIPVLEYLCLKKPDTYLLYSTLLEEFNYVNEAIEACNNYISATEESKTINAWKRLIRLYKGKKDYVAEVNSIINLCNIQESSDLEFSNLLKRFTHLLRVKALRVDLEKRLLANTIIEMASIKNEKGQINIDDRANLAWIYLHSGKKDYAAIEAGKVISEIPDHIEATKILSKLNIPIYL